MLPLAVGCALCADFQSDPVKHNTDLPSSKFTLRAAQRADEVVFGTDASELNQNPACPLDIDLVWTNHVQHGIYGALAF